MPFRAVGKYLTIGSLEGNPPLAAFEGSLFPTSGDNIFWTVDRPSYRWEEPKRATGERERLASPEMQRAQVCQPGSWARRVSML